MSLPNKVRGCRHNVGAQGGDVQPWFVGKTWHQSLWVGFSPPKDAEILISRAVSATYMETGSLQVIKSRVGIRVDPKCI